MQPIEASQLGHAINATADTSTDEEYMEAVLKTYLWAYDLKALEEVDRPRFMDLTQRMNGFQTLRDDERFELICGAGKNKFFGFITECLIEAEYHVNDEGIAIFDHDEIFVAFLAKAKQNAI